MSSYLELVQQLHRDAGAAGMEPDNLKKQFGGDVVLWGGGIDSQRVLPFDSPEKVKDEVRKNVGTFKPGGGYIFNNVHNIQVGVSAENIVAMYDAAYEYGFYE